MAFLIYPTERNIYDQRHLEYAIKRQNEKVRVVRLTLQDFQESGRLTENKTLIV